jgi:hypothetical protein
MVQHPRRQSSSYSPPWEPVVSTRLHGVTTLKTTIHTSTNSNIVWHWTTRSTHPSTPVVIVSLTRSNPSLKEERVLQENERVQRQALEIMWPHRLEASIYVHFERLFCHQFSTRGHVLSSTLWSLPLRHHCCSSVIWIQLLYRISNDVAPSYASKRYMTQCLCVSTQDLYKRRLHPSPLSICYTLQHLL